MNLTLHISISCLALLFALPSCLSERPLAEASSTRGSEGSTSVASVPGLAKQLGAPFQRHVPFAARPTPGTPDKQEREPFFAHPWNAEFRTEHDGSLSAVTQDESPPEVQGAHFRNTAANQRLATRFPATAAGDLEVTVGDKPGAWIRERIASASGESRMQLSEGRIVYAAAKPGLDRVYEVSGQRVEEYLRLRDADALRGVQYEVETGPGIADLVVDGSGSGLMAIDAEGNQILKAPQPTGVDAKGHRVEGKLDVTKRSEGHFTVRVALSTPPSKVSFPVLLDPSWASAGQMVAARNYSTATLLQNGKVLVAGGFNGGELAAAELYDPTSNTWAAVAPMNMAHFSAPATLLPNGKVLVAGGHDSSNQFAYAEIFDPATNTWSAAAAMSAARTGHSATLLPTGKVLVAGGSNIGAQHPSELYDPSTNSWTAVAPVTVPRYQHRANLLPNGKVLLSAGNDASNQYLKSSDLYDPGTNTWTSSAMSTGRRFHTATLLPNGKVMVAGGQSNPVTSSTELYDPTTNTWSLGASMSQASYALDAALLSNGQVLMAGGSTNLVGAALYNPVSNVWAATVPLVTGRVNHSVTLLQDGSVLVAAGSDSGGSGLATAERYDPTYSNGTTCTAASDCTSGFCADGVCCNTACVGRVCSLAGGATADGVCTRLAIGSSCDPSTPDDCLTGFCADGFCCNAACTGQCEACGEAGHEGACLPVMDAPRGDRPACVDMADGCEGRCNGAVTVGCSYPAQGTSCATVSCDGDVLTPSGLCDGAGICQLQTSENCSPYSCDSTNFVCYSTCVTSEDCAAGASCDSEGKCSLSGGSCQDATTAKSPDGTVTPCDPYRCLNGQCKSTCSTAADCAPGATCDGGQCTNGTGGTSGTAGSAGTSGTSGTSGTAGSSNPAAAPASGDSGGCSVPSGSRGTSGGVLVIAAIAAAVSRRRRAS